MVVLCNMRFKNTNASYKDSANLSCVSFSETKVVVN